MTRWTHLSKHVPVSGSSDKMQSTRFAKLSKRLFKRTRSRLFDADDDHIVVKGRLRMDDVRWEQTRRNLWRDELPGRLAACSREARHPAVERFAHQSLLSAGNRVRCKTAAAKSPWALVGALHLAIYLA